MSLIVVTKESRFQEKIEFKKNKIFSLPLYGILYIASAFGELYHPVLNKDVFHAGK